MRLSPTGTDAAATAPLPETFVLPAPHQSLTVVLPNRVLADDSSLLLYPGGDDPDGLASNQSTNTIFYDRTFNFSYSGGSVCLSSQDDMCTPPAIDDAVRIYVDGTQVLYQESYTHDFGPVDFSGKLSIGSNQVRVQIIDLMGPSRGGSALWLVTSGGGDNGDSVVQPTKASENGAPTQSPQIQSNANGTDGACPGFKDVSESEVIGLSDDGHFWVRESPSFLAPIVGEEPPNFSWRLLGFACQEGYTWMHGSLYPDESIIGWIAVYNPGSQPTTVVLTEPTQTAQMPTLPPNSPSSNSTIETWSTSISQCEVNPLIYEFYKDQDNQLKLVLATAPGIVNLFKMAFDWIGFLIDSSKVKFEPTADEVRVSLFYSNSENYKVQVDRYLKGNLLSSDVYNLDATTYQKYLSNLGSCGINT